MPLYDKIKKLIEETLTEEALTKQNSGKETGFSCCDATGSYIITLENEALLLEIIDEICASKNTPETVKVSAMYDYRISSEQVYNHLFKLIKEYKLENKEFSESDFSRFMNTFTAASKSKKTVFKKIYGIEINNENPYEFCGFTFYNTEKHLVHIRSKMEDIDNHETNIDWHISRLQTHSTWVSIDIETSDIKHHLSEEMFEYSYANVLSDEVFLRLEGLLRFMVYPDLFSIYAGTLSDIGIFSYRAASYTENIIVSPVLTDTTVQTKSGEHFFAKPVCIENLLENSKRELPNIEKTFQLCHDLNLCSKSLDVRLMNAIAFFSRAYFAIPKPVSFIDSVIAMEALINKRRNGVKKAFVDFYNYLLRVDKKELQKIYDVRSQLSHGAVFDVSVVDCRTALNLAYSAILKFITKKDENIQKFCDIDELDKFIQQL